MSEPVQLRYSERVRSVDVKNIALAPATPLVEAPVADEMLLWTVSDPHDPYNPDAFINFFQLVNPVFPRAVTRMAWCTQRNDTYTVALQAGQWPAPMEAAIEGYGADNTFGIVSVDEFRAAPDGSYIAPAIIIPEDARIPDDGYWVGTATWCVKWRNYWKWRKAHPSGRMQAMAPIGKFFGVIAGLLVALFAFKAIVTGETKIQHLPTCSTVITYPDGSTETYDSNGNRTGGSASPWLWVVLGLGGVAAILIIMQIPEIMKSIKAGQREEAAARREEAEAKREGSGAPTG